MKDSRMEIFKYKISKWAPFG
ncbi:hypothetical protein LCGC14_2719380, partial [marine sediment metagenome]